MPQVVAKLSTVTLVRSTTQTTTPVSRSGRRDQKTSGIDQMFDNFIADEPSLVAARDAAMAFVRAVSSAPYDDGYCLTLCGRSGTGKTFLERCILNALRFSAWGECDAIRPDIVGSRVRRFSAGFYDMRRVSDGFKSGSWGVVEVIEEKSLAVLDDIGSDYDPSKVTTSKVDRILRTRSKRWTVLTMNFPMNEIASRLDARIASFIIRDENKFVEIKAGDFAMRKFNKTK